MPDDEQDDSQKTEDPTQKRLDDALKKGQVPNSREVTSFLMLAVFALTLIWMSPPMMKKAAFSLTKYLESPHLFLLDSNTIRIISSNVLTDLFMVMLAPVSIIVLVIFISALMQHPITFSTQSIMPQLDRISPLKGIKRLFSLKSFVEFLKGIFKITLVGIIGYMAVAPELSMLSQIQSQGAIAILLILSKLATRLLIGICMFMGLIAVLDFLYQQFEHIKSLRMSKKDLKDEFKQTEGSPEIKAKLREIRRQRANNRMMSSVPDADVIITNPTHYAVALKYDQEISEAPIVVAKGKDLIALKIREIANENKVPIVENPPLARALFSSVEIEEEIPLEHYNAVAEIIKYVYKLKGKNPRAA